jgi:hypothetical protein
VQEQLVALKRLLELSTHEGVSSTRVLEDLKVDPEERKVDDEGEDDETKDSREEVLRELLLIRTIKAQASTVRG